MIILFGKFKGQSVESLKLSADGVSYLEWGAGNLRDEKWRKAFADVLAGMTDRDHAVIMVREDGIGYSEAMRHLADLRVQAEEDAKAIAEEDERQDGVLKRWAHESGLAIEKLRNIARRYQWHWEDAPRSMFSSDAAYQMFRKYMAEY